MEGMASGLSSHHVLGLVVVAKALGQENVTAQLLNTREGIACVLDRQEKVVLATQSSVLVSFLLCFFLFYYNCSYFSFSYYSVPTFVMVASHVLKHPQRA